MPVLKTSIPGETDEQTRLRGSLWLERGVLERLRVGLLPAAPPPEKAHVPPSSCWLWTGPVDGGGRGVIYNQERTWNINRLLYTLQYGPLSERDLLYSTCGVARCCNPWHHTAVARGPVTRAVAVCPRIAGPTATRVAAPPSTWRAGSSLG